MSGARDTLPPEIRELLNPTPTDEPTVLDLIGTQIAGKRDEAKSARTSSGIETTWRECEEAYLGIDDANRHEFTDAKWAKPMSMDGPVTTGRTTRGIEVKSTAYHRLTTRYVDAGVAKLGEILLPAGEKAFSFSEMPVPELIEAKEDESQVVHSDLGVPLTRPVTPGDAPPGQLPAAPAPARVPLTVKDLAIEKIEVARKKAKAAETRIYDWMVQTQYRAEIRKVIADAARIGVGVLKAPTPVSKRVMAITEAKDGGINLAIKEKIVPAAIWCDPWNVFPDPACGENIHDGDFVFERDHMSSRQVKGLKKLPGYIAAQIERVLDEGPEKINMSPDGASPNGNKNKGRFTVWYYHGTLTKEEVAAIDAAAGIQASSDDAEESHVIVTLINDSVVKATINPLDSGSFPYHSMPWQRRAQHWAGVGVAEQMRTPQRVTNAALRALLDNAGKSAGSQFVINEKALRPSNENWTITPDKIWMTTEDGPQDVRQAFMAIQVPNVTAQLMEIITMGERFAEETTSIPLIAQGQSGATTPDTFGAAQLQNNNANQLLRSIGYTFDDFITEPVVRQFYEWLLLDPEVPNEEKGEFQIDAHGSVALVERAIQDQSIAQMGGMAANPIYGIDPKRWAKEFLKTKRISPETMMYSEEEQAKLDAAPPPEAPAVAAAKIAADTQIKLGVMGQQSEQQSAAAEQKIADAANVIEGNRAATDQQALHVDSTIRLHELQMQHERALMEYASKRNISLDQAKAALAKTAMTLNVQRELNAADNAADLHKHHNPGPQIGMRPPGQLPGRSGNGRAFEQGPPQ